MTLELAPPIDFFLYTLGGIFINIRTFPYLKYISMFYFANEAILIDYWKDVKEIGKDFLILFREQCLWSFF